MASPSLTSFSFSTHAKKFFVSIQPPVGELMRPVFLTENEFTKEQGESPAAPSTRFLLGELWLFERADCRQPVPDAFVQRQF